MRTKKLLLAAVIGAACIASSSAQVFSLNVVGYVNKVLGPGLHLIANPLDNQGGNAVGDLIPGDVPAGTVLFSWNGSGWVQHRLIAGNWIPSAELNPGTGFFISIPSGGEASLTFVGEVPQGSLSVPLPLGLSLVSSVVPQEVAIANSAGLAEIGLSVESGDLMFSWNGSGWVQHRLIGANIIPAKTLAVGEGFFFQNNQDAAKSWDRDFEVN